MATTYHMKQIAGEGLATIFAASSLDNIQIESFPFPETQTIQKYQQIVATLSNDKTFTPGTSYMVKVKIPPNDYYNINYSIRLMKKPEDAQDLRDYNSYQLIKYISIPKYSKENPNINKIWLYRKDTDTSIWNAAIAKPLSELPTGDEAENKRATKIYYTKDDSGEVTEIQYYDYGGNLIDNALNSSAIDYIEYTIPVENTGTDPKPSTVREFIITPEVDDYDTIFFYMEPLIEDSNIWWYDDEELMYGRHVDISKIEITIYELNNIIDLNSNEKITNIGVWGRPEQLMALDGQEIQIGPSGYYELELNDYSLESLCIANTTESDIYTVDIQYKKTDVI